MADAAELRHVEFKVICISRVYFLSDVAHSALVMIVGLNAKRGLTSFLLELAFDLPLYL